MEGGREFLIGKGALNQTVQFVPEAMEIRLLYVIIDPFDEEMVCRMHLRVKINESCLKLIY